MKILSLRDAAFALDGKQSTTSPAWSLKESLKFGVFPAFASKPLSLREVTNRYSASGAALRSLSQGTGNAWLQIDRQTIVDGIADRLRDPFIMRQQITSFCGPFAILVEWIRRDPVNFINSTKELLETGKFTCKTGRIIEAEDDLRKRPAQPAIAQVEWLLAATIRDDENLTEDVNDGTDIEGLTMMGAMTGWTEDILNLTATELGGVLSSSGEDEMMHLAEVTVKAGGVAFLFIDSNMIKPGPNDTEEEMYFQSFEHSPRSPEFSSSAKVHSKDDVWGLELFIETLHWVSYLNGLNFGKPPESSDAVAIRLWSWGGEYVVTGTAEAFGEYLYGVVTGKPK
ncbi:hypothetical protein [Calothrix sp. 336/3]|uniref:hypothetical protein n=1 Tax=Calothrix sp. 336/3 TaxID=1337936 RepID=UPI0004E42753|nr:hypothetical protein [Calothrix sp. 336/3]AKG22557.1 hypothetical protein IJ00_15920 [Calothrix sp. 336/3]